MKNILFLVAIGFTCRAQTWLPVGTGMNGAVEDLTTYNGALYAGGQFSMAGGNHINDNIATWNGTVWDSVGTRISCGGCGGGYTSALAVYNNELYAGGEVGAGTLAKWDGTTWSNISAAPCDIISALAVYNGKLYGGSIDYVPCGGSHIIIYDGTIASTIPVSGSSASISTLCVYNGELYAGGTFTAIHGVSANNIAKFNGTSWLAVGTGINNGVGALCIYNGGLYAGTDSSVYKWNGTTWSALGTGLNGYVAALAVYNNMLWVGGGFTMAGSTPATNIATWDGTNWAAVGSGIGTSSTAVLALCVYSGELYAAGYFTTAGGNPANYIAKIDSTSMGIKQLANTIQVAVYPNPANTNLQITISGKQAVDISVYDILGKEVISTTEKNMDVSNLQEGVYFVTVKTNEGIATKKIIIQR